jgi:hypothetical protein
MVGGKMSPETITNKRVRFSTRQESCRYSRNGLAGFLQLVGRSLAVWDAKLKWHLFNSAARCSQFCRILLRSFDF